jgi:hypothetical protein
MLTMTHWFANIRKVGTSCGPQSQGGSTSKGKSDEQLKFENISRLLAYTGICNGCMDANRRQQ